MTINAHHHIVIMIHKKCMPGGPKSANQKLADEGKHTRQIGSIIRCLLLLPGSSIITFTFYQNHLKRRLLLTNVDPLSTGVQDMIYFPPRFVVVAPDGRKIFRIIHLPLLYKLYANSLFSFHLFYLHPLYFLLFFNVYAHLSDSYFANISLLFCTLQKIPFPDFQDLTTTKGYKPF